MKQKNCKRPLNRKRLVIFAAFVALFSAIFSAGQSLALTVPVADDTNTSIIGGIETLKSATAKKPMMMITSKAPRALLRFNLIDLNMVPGEIAPENIVAATLQFYVISVKNPGLLIVSNIDTPWDETSNAMPAIGSTVGWIEAWELMSKSFVSLDVTEAVRNQLGNGTSFGFSILGTNQTMRMMLAAKNGSSAGVSARVEIVTNPWVNVTETTNTFVGTMSGNLLTTGVNNTAAGYGTLVENTTGLSNSAFGTEALAANTEGEFNSAHGVRALFSNTTGVRNSAFGVGALQSNISGNFNSSFGYTALYSNTTGQNNSAFGTGALAANTLGVSNSAFGSEAMLANTTGYNNTAMGLRALYENTTGFDNTAFGRSSMLANTTGALSTAVGVDAMRDNTTGWENTALGHSALRSNTTGNYNVSIGRSALSSKTTGDFNTAVGRQALALLTAGTSNTALGHLAGGGLITGSNNIYIGNGGASNESNTIRIGTDGFHNRVFINGVRGAVTGIPDAISVMIDSNGQLGTISSSARYKEDIRDMLARSERIYDLRPVVFRYREAFANGSKPEQFGLIAEQVAEVFPELVVLNEDNLPETVKYHDLAVLLLNELQKERARSQSQEEKLEHLQASLEQLNKTTQQLVKRMEEQELVPVSLTKQN
jgi:hypothetical protein